MPLVTPDTARDALLEMTREPGLTGVTDGGSWRHLH